ncbi:MAG: translocation/assembly module TamB domain-containing protein, partial [Gammaproteobacteria bacterium]
VTLRLERLDGQLRGQPVAGAGVLGLAGSTLTASGFALSSGANRLTLDGEVGEQARMAFALDAPSLDTLWPGLRGRANGQGEVTGARERPRVKAELQASGLGFEAFELASLKLNAEIDAADERASSIRIELGQLNSADVAIPQIGLGAHGTLGTHEITLAATLPQGVTEARLRGGLALDQKSWRGRLERLSVNITDVGGHGLGRWSLAAPAGIEVTPQSASAGSICLARRGASACAQGKWSADSGVDARAKLNAIPLGLAGPWLPQNISAKGQLALSASAIGQGDELRARAQLSGDAGSVTLERAGDTPVTVAYRRITASADYESDGVQATIDLNLDPGGGIEGQVEVGPADAAGTRVLSGRARGGLPDLRLLTDFTDVVDDLRGRIELDARVAGTTVRPNFSGTVNLVEGSAKVPDAGIDIEDLSFNVRGDGGQRLRVDGRARSGGGRLRVSGAVRLDPDAGWPSSLRVEGDRFEAAKLPNLQMIASPSLDVEFEPKSLVLKGGVDVPQAAIVFEDLPPSAVKLSGDEVIVRQTPRSRARTQASSGPGIPVGLDIEIELGDAVTVEGFGLLARLAGHLRIRQEPGGFPTAVGELQLVDGTYTAYGQDLTIERGRLIFSGALDNPGLDILATRTVGDIVAGLALTGTASEVESRLFSRPPLGQADVLAYLLTGGPLSGASQDQGALLAQAAFSLGVSNSASLTSEIASAVGLDELSVVGSGVETAGVQIGKRLGERIYARYVIGLFNTVGSLLLSYRLTDSLKLEAQTGQTQGLDLIYSIEREDLFGGRKRR